MNIELIQRERMVAVFGKIGIPELILILAVALIVFGPRKLPEIGRAIGSGLREFRQATQEVSKSVNLESISKETKNEARTEKVQDKDLPDQKADPNEDLTVNS